MLALYPNGFEGHQSRTCGWNGWMNHIRNAAESCREDQGSALYPEAASRGSAPGIEATKDAAEGVLGIEIPYPHRKMIMQAAEPPKHPTPAPDPPEMPEPEPAR